MPPLIQHPINIVENLPLLGPSLRQLSCVCTWNEKPLLGGDHPSVCQEIECAQAISGLSIEKLKVMDTRVVHKAMPRKSNNRVNFLLCVRLPNNIFGIYGSGNQDKTTLLYNENTRPVSYPFRQSITAIQTHSQVDPADTDKPLFLMLFTAKWHPLNIYICLSL